MGLRRDRSVFCVTPGFLLLAAALYFVSGGAALTAFFTAALAHELGHLLAIWLTGAAIYRVRLTAAGLVIEYGGLLTRRQEMGIVAAGPVAGLLFALGCFLADMPYFRYAGAIALLAAAFNLLPVPPLDGGRLARFALTAALPEKSAAVLLRGIGSVCSCCVALTGVWLRTPAAVGAGVWLLVLANAPDLR